MEFAVRRTGPTAFSSIEVRPFSFGRLVIVAGALDVHSASDLLLAAGAAVDEREHALVIDLDETTSVDAFGRAALRLIARHAARLHKRLLVVAGSATRLRLGDLEPLPGASRLVPNRRIARAAAIATSVR